MPCESPVFLCSSGEFLTVLCQYAVASWDVPNCPGLWNTLLLLPCSTSGLIGAVFSSVGKPELPLPSGSNSLACPTSLFEGPVQLDILNTELRSFCPFNDPIQIVGRDQTYVYDEPFASCGMTSGSSDSMTESGSSGRQSQIGSPEACKTLGQQESAYTQPDVPQLVEPRIYPEETEPSQQTFAFDFDFDGGAWVSTDSYAQLGNNLPKDQLDWTIQGLGFPELFA